MIPLITFDVLVNVRLVSSALSITRSPWLTLVQVYLTILFLLPLSSNRPVVLSIKLICTDLLLGLYSFKNAPKSPSTLKLRTVALRTLVGALGTLSSSVM
jgi:hypothetical protein